MEGHFEIDRTYYTRRVDWLFVFSLVVFARYVLVPLAANREQTKRYWRRINRDPLALFGIGFLAFFFAVALIAPEFRGIGRVNMQAQLQPPVFFSVDASRISYYNCVGEVVNGRCYGTWAHPLGTNGMGIDVLSMLVYALREILQVALSAAVLMGIVATAVGATAGYFGGWVDDVLMRDVDVQQTVPAIVVYVFVATLVLRDKGLFVFIVFFGLLDWGGIARLVRSEVLKRRSEGYVRAATAAGASDLHVIRRHVIPNSTATIVTALTRQIPLLILAQVALAYLKLNTVNFRSLGEVLRRGLSSNPVPWHTKWWVTGFSVLFLVATVVAFNVFGDVVRDVLDPQEEVA